jgi:hypothetical protein
MRSVLGVVLGIQQKSFLVYGLCLRAWGSGQGRLLNRPRGVTVWDKGYTLLLPEEQVDLFPNASPEQLQECEASSVIGPCALLCVTGCACACARAYMCVRASACATCFCRAFNFGAYACVVKLCIRQQRIATATLTSNCFTVRKLLSFIEYFCSILYALYLHRHHPVCSPVASSVLCSSPRCYTGEYSLLGRRKEYSS